jgi:acyl-CoA thioesterase
MSAFDLATAVQQTGPGRYSATVDPAWSVRKGANGGYAAGLLLRALMAEVGDPARTPRSLTVHYPAAVEAGPADIAVQVERSGRSMTTATARIEQQGSPAALAMAAFSTDRHESVDFVDMAMPKVPPVDGLQPLVLPEMAPPFAANLQVWLADGAAPFTGAEHAYAALWLSLRQPRPLDYPLLAALTDFWMPVLFATRITPVMSPTIDLTVHFRSPITAAAATGPWLGVFRTRLARGGFMEEDGEVWSADGTLLAQSRQLALAVPAAW